MTIRERERAAVPHLEQGEAAARRRGGGERGNERLRGVRIGTSQVAAVNSGLFLRVPGGFQSRDYAGRLDRTTSCVMARCVTGLLGRYLYIRPSRQADHREGCRVAAGRKVHLVALRSQPASQ